MSTVTFFWIVLGCTVVLIATTFWTGWNGRRRPHFVLAPVTIVSLVVTILLAEAMASLRVFPKDEMAVHLVFAKAGGLLVLPVIATGLLLVRRPRYRKLHLAAVIVFLLGVVCATCTGIYVFSLSTPR